MDENQTSEPQHSSGFISIRLSPADAQSYRFVRLLALHEQPPAFGSLPEDEPNLSELSASLAESNDRCFGAFQDDQPMSSGFLAILHPTRSTALILGLYVLPAFVAMAVVDRWSGKL